MIIPSFRVTHRFLFAAATLVFVVASAMPAAAQQFTFDKKKYVAKPGEIVPIKIVASEFGTAGGLNFTVRISTENGKLVRLLDATSQLTPTYSAIPNYGYAFNALRRTDVTSGVIKGDVMELRGVFYQTKKATGLPFGSPPRELAEIQLPIDIKGEGRVLIELVSAVDSGVALLGGTKIDGSPILPTGEAVPRGDLATIQVARSDGPNVTDFTDPHNFDGWNFEHQLPTTGDPQPIGESVAGEGLSIRAAVDNSFGFWAWDFWRGAWRNPPADSLLVVDWHAKSDGVGPEVPPIRLRVMTDNHLQSCEMVLQDLPENNDQMNLMPGAQGRTFRTISHVPAFAADGFSDDGMNPYFDLMRFGYGKLGTTLTLQQLTEWVVSPSSLKNRQLIYAQTFDQNTDGGWRFTPGTLGGREVSFSRSRYGLGIQSGGPLEYTSTGHIFSYGFWYADTPVLKIKANPSKWYKVEGLFTGTAENPFWNAAARLRIFPKNYEVVAGVSLATVLDEADYHMPRMGLEGTVLQLWFQPPPELNDVPLALAFDLIHLNAPEDGSENAPALFLKWLTVTQYDAPVLPQSQEP